MNLKKEVDLVVDFLIRCPEFYQYGHFNNNIFHISTRRGPFTEFQQELIGYFFLYISEYKINNSLFLITSSKEDIKKLLLDIYFDINNKYSVIYNDI